MDWLLIPFDLNSLLQLMYYAKNRPLFRDILLNKHNQIHVQISNQEQTKHMINLLKELSILQIPVAFEFELKSITSISNASEYFSYIIENLLALKFKLSGDTSPKTTIEIYLLKISFLWFYNNHCMRQQDNQLKLLRFHALYHQCLQLKLLFLLHY